MDPAALRLVAVSKRYAGQAALSSVSLHVRPGDCYGFLGHNGAGKTTAMRIALGLVRPDAGRVLVEGFDAAEHPLEARARMGALIEVPGFHAALSGHRNLVLLARLQGIPRREAARESSRVLEAVGLAHAADKPAGAYSQGMRQRLGIAQALLGRPRIVLLDEPTNGLDPEGIEEMRRLLRRVTREEGATVLLSSHQLHEISGLCNRIGIVRQGRLLVEDETSRLIDDGGARRYVIRAGRNADRTRDVLAVSGLTVASAADVGTFEVDVRNHAPSNLLRGLLEADVEVRSFAPRETTLEEIYLRFTRGAGAGAAQDAAPLSEADTAPAAKPRERIAPPGPIRRVAAYDVRRWFAGPAVPLCVAGSAAAALVAVLALRSSASAQAERVAAGDLFDADQTTAFAATAAALKWSVPLLVLVVAATAALSVAGEFGRGTLRNVLLRPVGRSRAALGKTAGALALAAAGYVLTIAAALGFARAFYSFEDLSTLLVTGKRVPQDGFTAAELWPEVGTTLLHLALPVAAFAGIGTLLGTLTRTGAAAVVAVFAATLVLVSAPAIVGRDAAAWLPSAHLPWGTLTDKSAAGRLQDTAFGISNSDPVDPRGPWVAAGWLVGTTALACVVLRRRAVP